MLTRGLCCVALCVPLALMLAGSGGSPPARAAEKEEPWFRDATKEYGPIGTGPAALVDLDGDGYPDLICDGIHTTPEIVRLFWRAKGPERAILITDALAAAGMPNGNYVLGGFEVEVKDGRAMARGAVSSGFPVALTPSTAGSSSKGK